MAAAKPLEKISPDISLILSAVTVAEACLDEAKANYTTLFFQAYTSADTRFEDLHNCNHHSTASIHKESQFPCTKAGLFSTALWGLDN